MLVLIRSCRISNRCRQFSETPDIAVHRLGIRRTYGSNGDITIPFQSWIGKPRLRPVHPENKDVATSFNKSISEKLKSLWSSTSSKPNASAAADSLKAFLQKKVPSTDVCDSIIGFMRKGRLAEAEALFKAAIANPDKYHLPIIYAFMIAAYQQRGEENKMIQLWKEMTEKRVRKSPEVYSTMIRYYEQKRDVKGAEALLEDMKNEMEFDSLALNSLINTLISLGSVEAAASIFESAVRANISGLKPYAPTISKVLVTLSKNGEDRRMLELLRLVQNLRIQTDIVSSNAVIATFAGKGEIKVALEIMDQLVREGVKPDFYTYSPIIRHFAKKLDINEMMNYFGKMLNDNVQPTASLYETIIRAFTSIQDPFSAEKHYKQMRKRGLLPTAFTLNSMISAFTFRKNKEKAVEYFNEMLACGLKPDGFTYQKLLRAVEGDPSSISPHIATAWGDSLRQIEVKPDIDTYNRSLSVIGMLDSDYAIRLFDDLLKEGVTPNVQTFESVIESFRRSTKDAQQLLAFFARMKELGVQPQVSTWNALFSTLQVMGNNSLIFVLFGEMKQQRFTPNLETYTIIFEVCGATQMQQLAEQYLEELKDVYNLTPDANLTAAIIGCRLKCGQIGHAVRLLDEMKERNEPWPFACAASLVLNLPESYIKQLADQKVFSNAKEAILVGQKSSPQGLTTSGWKSFCILLDQLRKGT
eukprot:TRINITY_DN9441_c0_g1_i1.p1 TRINITY_DN9441_c0_g1~~TRINITY_DN9441_c0_g1_i1.p1  ORF type:complete len:699 (-),score=169.70 TRINITY_DN9441_c0_g1_i1:10-2106(-)